MAKEQPYLALPLADLDGRGTRPHDDNGEPELVCCSQQVQLPCPSVLLVHQLEVLSPGSARLAVRA
eukprot:151403-Pyramimonas_sp.AAC.1